MHSPDSLPLEESSLKITRWFGNSEYKFLMEILALIPEVGSMKTFNWRFSEKSWR
jgi:hypothetical protein